jgi:mono/diheme cytochrome c family protein
LEIVVGNIDMAKTARVRRLIIGTLLMAGLPAILIAVLSLASRPTHAQSAPDAPAAQASAATPDAVDFARDIQPIFQNGCYKCHDAAKHKGGLRLDSKATAFIGGDSGDPSLVPHDPDHSKLVTLVRGDDPSSVMPPKGDRLTAQQVDLLVRWVKQGANWPDGVDHPSQALTHWSFRKPERPALPGVKKKEWVRNPIDAFVLARLEKEGLCPSPEADRYTLIRRLSLDLIGLPPTPAETQAFVNDNAPDAYEKLVDRLQSNPHYGERWARMWLDCARYADSAGYGSDPLRMTCSRYRDWVIQAFNNNLPYDRFTVEQIAGDLLPNPTTDQLIATGFNRNTMTNTEGGTDPEEFRVAAIKDRVDTTVQTWMGLTMGCAQCHTHKYDPITNREYYQLFAIFNQSEDANRQDEAPTIPTPSPADEAKRSDKKSQIAAIEAKLDQPAQWAEAQAKWEQSLSAQMPQWVALDPQTFTSANGATLTKADDKSLLASGTRPTTDTYTLTANSDLKGITAFRVEALPDPSLPNNGPGRHDNGGFVLNHFHVTVAPAKAGPVHGRFVRIELPGHEKILHLAEVQVFHGSENLALKGKATQSTTAFAGDAQFAIDGFTDGDFVQHKTSHTAESDNPWWEVDLGSEQDLDKVVIWNRTDSSLQRRLSDFRVLVLDEKKNPAWESEIGPPPMPTLEIDLSAPRAVALKNASDSFHQSDPGEWPASKAIGKEAGPDSGWAIFPQAGKAHEAVFETAAAVGGDGPVVLTFTLKQNFPDASLGRFRISATTSPRPVRVLPAAVTEALAIAPEQRSDEQKGKVFAYFKSVSPQLEADRKRIAKLKKEMDEVKPQTTAIMRELPKDKRRECRILIKGNFLVKGPKVDPAVLAAFNPLPQGAPADRLGLARWIVDRENPLAARVAANRFWAQLFGVGIVETQEDFGTQGQTPSNQDLLDWLAVEFRDGANGPEASAKNAWDMKALVRLMVTSAAYRQSSRVTPELIENDPRNRLISRGPRHRLEAELVRDQALALSGLLSGKMFGPSVFPPQPDGLWQAAFNGERTYPTSTGEDKYRRGIYVFWRRTVPYPSMSAFDAPSREICALRRIPTSTPLQAFVTLNDPVYVECAQSLARRIVKEGGATIEERATYALTLCLCRPPEPAQVARLVALYNEQVEHYRSKPAEAEKIASAPIGPLPAGLEPADAAAWTVCANVLLNLDGVLTK